MQRGEKNGRTVQWLALEPFRPDRAYTLLLQKSAAEFPIVKEQTALSLGTRSPAEPGQRESLFDGPIELQAQFLHRDLALLIQLAIQEDEGVKQIEGQQGDQ